MVFEHHAALLASSDGLHEVDVAEALRLFPLLRAEGIAAASYEEDARDIDVAALHQGWLKAAKAAGATILTNAAVTQGGYRDGRWTIETKGARIIAGTVVNAAGAWADTVAQNCGVEPIGLTPMRRSIAVLPTPEDMIRDIGRSSATPPKPGIASPMAAGCWFRRRRKLPSTRTTPSSTTWCLPRGSTASRGR